VTSRVDQLDNHGALGDGDGDWDSKSGVDRANGEGESRAEEVGDDHEPEQRVKFHFHRRGLFLHSR